MSKLIVFTIIVLAGAFCLWVVSDNADARQCKAKYGNSYSLWHSPANSSVKACVAPDGVMKQL